MDDYRDSDLVKRLISEGMRPKAAGTAKGHGKSAGHPKEGEGCPAAAQRQGGARAPMRIRKSMSLNQWRIIRLRPLLKIMDGGKR
jgi:hypothetical protein